METTLDILICAIDRDIEHIPDMILPRIEGIRYVISLQYTDESYLSNIPQELALRDDIVVVTLPGRGLSRNRNNALSHSNGDIRLTADADNRYTVEGLKVVRDTFDKYPDADIICFSALSYDGKPMKKYPMATVDYADARRLGYYPSSHELAIRKGVSTLFDERFGLGSECLKAGEEDVFLKDASDAGYRIMFVPEFIVSTDPDTTGDHFLEDPRLQLTKGAVFNHIFGTWNAVWRSFKEAGYHFVHSRANPFAIFHNMIKGIWMFR